MDKIYSLFDSQSFKKAATFAVFLCDFLVFWYLTIKKANVYKLVMQGLTVTNPQLKNNQDPNLIKQLFTLMDWSFYSLVALFIVGHWVVYFLWHKDKASAGKYIRLLAWSGGVGGLLFGITGMGNPLTGAIALGAGLLYMFVAIGLGYFPNLVANPQKRAR